MSRERALAQLQAEGWGDRVRFFEANTATVALAAQALGCEPAHIAKTLALARRRRSSAGCGRREIVKRQV